MSELKINRWLLLDNVDFRDVDYVRGLPLRLAPEHTFDRGTIVRTIYYADSSLNPMTGQIVYSDPIIREEYDYVMNPQTGLAISRELTISWYFEDDTFHPLQKIRKKTYTLQEALAEGARRRRNVIFGLQKRVIEILFVVNGGLQGNPDATVSALAQAQAFSATHQTEIADYLETGSEMLKNAINASSDAWLDAVVQPPSITARMVIIDEI